MNTQAGRVSIKSKLSESLIPRLFSINTTFIIFVRIISGVVVGSSSIKNIFWVAFCCFEQKMNVGKNRRNHTQAILSFCHKKYKNNNNNVLTSSSRSLFSCCLRNGYFFSSFSWIVSSDFSFSWFIHSCCLFKISTSSFVFYYYHFLDLSIPALFQNIFLVFSIFHFVVKFLFVILRMF